MTKEEAKAYAKAYYKAHRDEHLAKVKAWKEANREQVKAYNKAWCEAHKEQMKATTKAWREAHKEEIKAYNKSEVNSLGQTKNSIRLKSNRYLKKYGTNIPGYEIHHCCTYDEPYKFIYCSIEMHRTIHQYLRDNNISADSDHYIYIEHLLDDSVVKYGFN